MSPNADQIHDAVLDCLLTNDEVKQITPEDLALLQKDQSDAATCAKYSIRLVHGALLRMGLHQGRLEKYRPMVIDSIKNLDPVFSHMGGSFLMLCMNKDGGQWGEHQNVDELLALALGLGMCEFTLPRHLWGALPGNLPIVRFMLPKEEACKTT
jgi:hypothetical protein